MADTCLFVAPRQGIRLHQCVGRVLRQHAQKVDALIVAPPIVRDDENNLEEDVQLVRLMGELAKADALLEASPQAGERWQPDIILLCNSFCRRGAGQYLAHTGYSIRTGLEPWAGGMGSQLPAFACVQARLSTREGSSKLQDCRWRGPWPLGE